MFFILSKTLAYLILPVPLLALLLLIYLFFRNRKIRQVSLVAFCGLFFLFTNPYVANMLMRWWEVPATPIRVLDETYDAGIILTGVTAMGEPPYDRVHLHKGADRIMHTVQLYKLGKIQRIIVSGGSGKLLTEDEPAEAVQIKRVLLISGVAKQDIILEENSRNTYENALYTAELLQEVNIPKDNLLLVTSAFHMRRALGCFRQAGINPEAYSTDFYSNEPSYMPTDLVIPSEEAIQIWTRLNREWVGYIMYDVLGYL